MKVSNKILDSAIILTRHSLMVLFTDALKAIEKRFSLVAQYITFCFFPKDTLFEDTFFMTCVLKKKSMFI